MNSSSNVIRVSDAKVVKGRTQMFDDPMLEELLARVAKLTQRTAIITSLFGTEVNSERLKDHLNKIIKEQGGTVNRPRGFAKSFHTKSFLATPYERYDAAYLIALHFGAAGPGAANVETSRQSAIERRLETYHRYRADLYENPDHALLCFETYIVLLQAISEKACSVMTCQSCSSRYIWTSGSKSKPNCPVCHSKDFDIEAAKQKLESLLKLRASSKLPTQAFDLK